MDDKVTYSAYELCEDFADGPPLIPDGWTPLLWCDDPDHDIQVHPSSVPQKGQIVAILTDRRIVPGDVYHIKMLNGIKPPQAKTDLDSIVIDLIYPKQQIPIREVLIARYIGTDQIGCPIFVGIGHGRVNTWNKHDAESSASHYTVAWKKLNIPTIDDVEI